MTGTIGGTYVQFGADLASVLDDGDEMRVLPIIGRGSVQSIADILFLKGVDLGIMRADTLDYLERKGYTGNIRGQFAYITKLYNEEMHVVAKKSIKQPRRSEGQVASPSTCRTAARSSPRSRSSSGWASSRSTPSSSSASPTKS